MSGPIVRTGTTPEFWKNYDKIFGEKKTTTAGRKKKVTKAKATAKATKKKAKKKG